MAAKRKPKLSGWWGDGPPPHERWPGVTIAIDGCNGKFHFDPERADIACEWFPKYCSHSKGDFAGQAFALLDYQTQLILRPLFGWVDRKGARRFRKSYIQIPKKNGKTQLIAGLGLLMLCADKEPGAEVYVAAGDRFQAGILFKAACAMVDANPKLKARLIVQRNSIIRKDDPTAFFQVLSSEAATKHGPNIHCLIIDELHAQPDRDLTETLTRGVIARKQPLILMITTAGDDDESICAEEREYALGVLNGRIEDETHLPVIFEARPDEDWQDPAVWARVNPGLGHTIQLSAIETFAREAANEPRKRNDFLRYHLNRWVNQATAWIPVDWWDACSDPMPSDEELAMATCAVGVDMSQKIDLTSEVAVFRIPLAQSESSKDLEITTEDAEGKVVKYKHRLNYRIAIVPEFWLPEDTLKERVEKDRVPYDQWRDQGLLNVTEGTVIDSDAVVQKLVALTKRFPLLKQAQVGYDPAFATELALELRDTEGFQVVEVLQGYKYLNEACQVFEALVKAGRVIHGGHRLLRWNIENVAVKRDDSGRIRPVKPRRPTKRIDGVVATLIGLSRLMVTPDMKRRKSRRAKFYSPQGFRYADTGELVNANSEARA